MEQAARAMGSVGSLESVRARGGAASLRLELEVSDAEVLAELRRHAEGDERNRFALTALRVGVLALRSASGQVDATSIREAGDALVTQMREMLSPDGSLLATSLATHLGEGSPLLKLLSPTDATGLRAHLGATIQEALAEQRKHILREFSLDDERSAVSRLSKMFSATSEQIGKNFTLDDEGSALARLKRELDATIERLARDNAEFQARVGEALARLDTRRKEEARTPRHGVEFEERLGALLAGEAQRLGDLCEATGDTTGVIKNCKVGDVVIELGADSAAAHARVVWEAKDKNGYSLRAALEEIDEARRNRNAQVGVFVFSRKTAPEELEPLQRHGSDVIVAWDPDDSSGDLIVRAAYSLSRALAVRERRDDRESQAAMVEIDRATRGIEKQICYLEDVRKWAETVRGHGDKIAERSARMAEELKRDVQVLDAHVGAMRRADPPM